MRWALDETNITYKGVRMSNFQEKYKQALLYELNNYIAFDDEEKLAKDQILDYLDCNDVILAKENLKGHIVASAWIVNKSRNQVVLTHHKKLNIWAQLGGHKDENENPFDAALREGYEESGLENTIILNSKTFDLDVHIFPPNENSKEHYHYDIRYIFEVEDNSELTISSESKDLRWIDFDNLENVTNEKALIRMKMKSHNY
jgi:8-oxo-dGTP pyrophosphatase MutT (NUDIX family)